MVLAARLFLGIVLLGTALTRFFNFEYAMRLSKFPPRGIAFILALRQSGFAFGLLLAAEIVTALLLLTGQSISLALLLFLPVLVGIICFHVFLDPRPTRLIFVALMSSACVLLFFDNWDTLKQLI